MGELIINIKLMPSELEEGGTESIMMLMSKHITSFVRATILGGGGRNG